MNSTLSPSGALPLETGVTGARKIHVDDCVDEIVLLRASLADLAGQLEAERLRVSTLEAQRRTDEEKTAMLRSLLEESRRALMRMQLEASRRPEQQNGASRRGSLDQDFASPARRGSFLKPEHNLPRRRSSLALVAVSSSPAECASPPEEEQPSALSGLGLTVHPRSPVPTTFGASKGNATATPLARYAYRRGSASVAGAPQDDEEGSQRTSRLRESRLGVHSTKVASRRSSAISGLPDFVQPGDFELALERRLARRLSTSSRGGLRLDDGTQSDDGSPISVNLNLLGRKHSSAVFESWSRRSSTTDSKSDWSFSAGSHCSGDEHLSDLRLQLEGLQIQLAEAQEGRRASEACLVALRTYITSSESRRDTLEPVAPSLPPLPTDASLDTVGNATPLAAGRPSESRRSSRWSLPRISFSLPSREAGTPCHMSRKPSDASSTSSTTLLDARAAPSIPSFSAFSFSALASRSATTISAETSPRMPCSQTIDSDPSFPRAPFPLRRSHSSRPVSTFNDGSGHAHSASIDDAASLADSVAPSLVSDQDSASAWSATSSRAPSPTSSLGHLPSLAAAESAQDPDELDPFVCPEASFALRTDEALWHSLGLSDGSGGLGLCGEFDASNDAVIEAARMPIVKGNLVALSSAVKQRQAARAGV